ncbi:MAG: orotidine-5'-phosphate decarboxylase [Chloroflexota bacterium]
MNFYEKLVKAIEHNESLLCIGLDPVAGLIPDRYRANQYAPQITTDEYLAWHQAIIAETCTSVCAYKPNIAFYEAMGAQGMNLLRKTMELIPAEIPVILDAKRGDIGSTASAYAAACFEELHADAVTLSPYLGRDSIAPFMDYEDKGLFILCHTSNPGAGDFQLLEIADWSQLDRESNWPLYLHVASQATGWSPQVGLVVGATFPDAMRAVRQVAPNAFILAPGIGTQGGDLESTIEAGIRSDRSGMIINASRSIATAPSHGDAANALRIAINKARESISTFAPARPQQPLAAKSTTVSSTTSTVEESKQSELEKICIELAELGAIKFGAFTLASGMTSPFYIDLRLVVSRPTLLKQIAAAYTPLLSELTYDRIAGVPYAGLPIAVALATHTNVPMLYTRKERKEHGLGKDVEGDWHPGERVVVIEDVITSGGSILDSVLRLRALGLIVEDAIVLIDREHNGEERLQLAGVRLHSVIGLSDLLHILVESGHLNEDKLEEIIRFVNES